MVDVIDPNITARINPGGNMLTQVGQFAYIQNALNQNALFQQTFRARQAMGPISQKAMQDATGPDGKPDMDKYADNLAMGVSTHPETSFIAPDILNTLASTKRINAETQHEKLTIAQQRLGILGQGAAGWSKTLDGKPGSDIGAFYALMDGAGAFDPAKRAEHIAWLATMNALPIAEQKKRLAQLALGSFQGQESLSKVNGSFMPDLYRDQYNNSYPGWASSVMGTTSPAGGAASFGGPAPGGPLPPSQGFGAPGATPEQPQPQPQAPQQPAQPQQPQLQLSTMKPGDQLQSFYKKGTELDNAAEYSRNFMNVIEKGEQLLKNAATGRAIPTRLELGRWMEAAGFKKSDVEAVVGGSLNDTQAMSKLILFIGTQGMRQANEGNASVRSVQEWAKFMEANPNLANDKGAIREMWDYMRFQATLKLQEQKQYRTALGGSMQDKITFEPDWNEYVGQKMKQHVISRAGWDWDKGPFEAAGGGQ